MPPTALTVVGIVNFPTGTIELTGPHSQRAIADWLGLPHLEPAELRESGGTITGNDPNEPHLDQARQSTSGAFALDFVPFGRGLNRRNG